MSYLHLIRKKEINKLVDQRHQVRLGGKVQKEVLNSTLKIEKKSSQSLAKNLLLNIKILSTIK